MSVRDGDKWLANVAKRMKEEFENGNAPTPERLTARELIGKYGFLMRGAGINSHIQNGLDDVGLQATPDFTNVWLDATISIELDSAAPGTSSDARPGDPVQRIDLLEAAHNEPVCVKSGAKLNVATALMLLHDYSQLPVMDNSSTVKGIISWQSIGSRFALGLECENVRQCMEPAERIPNVAISKKTPLLEAIGIIVKQGYVLIHDPEAGNAIIGIVTAADISNRFAVLAEPFLLVGEIEKHLRNLVHHKFTLEELRAAAGYPKIKGYADMTLGGYQHLLGNSEHWECLKLNIDRKEFVKHLDRVREIRNSIMHFNPDGISDEDMQLLRDVARFFDGLARMGAM